jgi:hypothetical protein
MKMVNHELKISKRKQSTSFSRYYPKISLEALMKTMKNLSQAIQSLSQI